MSTAAAATSTPASPKSWSILGKNLKANSAADLEPYLSELKAMDDVEEVHLGGNSLGVEACVALAEVFGSKKGLKIVDLADIFTGRLISEIPQALSALCTSLSTHPSLIELDLSDNAFGGRCADAMVPFLSTNTSFQVFKLNNNGLGIWGGQVVSKALLDNATKCLTEGKESSLRVLVCGRNRLENGSAPDWAKAFAAHKGLKQVRMPQNGIRMEGIKAIVDGLANCQGLEVLDLQDNTATRSGTRAIVRNLPSWKGLRVLNLSDCLLSAAGGIALASALAQGNNKELRELKLQYGEFDKRTVDILVTAVQQHLTLLEVVELNGNRFDAEDECVERLKEALALHGHEDALDELDDMEEVDEDEEEEDDSGAEDSDDADNDADDDGKADDGVAKGEASDVIPPVSDKATDELADLLAGASIQAK